FSTMSASARMPTSRLSRLPYDGALVHHARPVPLSRGNAQRCSWFPVLLRPKGRNGTPGQLDDAIRAEGGSATLVPLDLKDQAGIATLAAALDERSGFWVTDGRMVERAIQQARNS